MQSPLKYTLLLALGLSAHTLQAQDILYGQAGSLITIQNGAGATVQGSVTLANGSTLTNEGTIWISTNNNTGVANWLDQTVTPYFYGDDGTFIFNSTGAQTATSPNRFGLIQVRNAGLTLGSHITAFRWQLHTGIVTTGSFRAVALSTAELAVAATASNPNFTQSWFNGTLRRYMQPSLVDDYIFPVGSATRVNRAELDSLTLNPINATYIDATFITPKPGTDVGLDVIERGVPYTSVHSEGVWNLVPNVASLSGSLTLRLYTNGFSGLTDNMYAILQRGVSSTNAADWQAPAGSNMPSIGSPGRRVADGYVQRSLLSTLGQNGIGMTDMIILPITLVNFTAKRINPNQVNVSWETSSEERNSYFHIERKTAGESSFTTVGIVPTSYNGSGTQTYHHNDPNADKGLSWYRLKIVSPSGKVSYSVIRTVNGTPTSSGRVTIGPNPNKGSFSFSAEGTKANQAFLIDAKGRLIKKLPFEENTPVYVTGLSAGVYFLTIPHFSPEGAYSEKIVVVH